MSSENIYLFLAIAAGVALLLLVFGVGYFRRRPKHLDVQKFQTRWQEVQKLCANKETWPLAIINGDKLLDDALKQCHYKGKSMGERLVAAQREISENDTAWYGHKLRNKLVHEEVAPLKQGEVVRVLAGFRQALKDLGALK